MRYFSPILFVFILLQSSWVQAADADELGELGSDIYLRAIKQAHDKKLYGAVGGLLFNSQRLVGSKDRVSGAFPVLIMSYANSFYWNIGSGGYWFYTADDRRLRFAAVVKLRPGYKTDDDDLLQGMEERKLSLDAGIRMKLKTGSLLTNAAVYTDIANRSDGQSASLKISLPFKLATTWRLSPSLSVDWLSDDLVDYYYGVRASEATGSRPEYHGRATLNSRIGLNLSHRFAKDWLAFAGASYLRLGDGLYDSPIVQHKGIATYYIGAGWIF